jgi:hypothetical protein
LDQSIEPSALRRLAIELLGLADKAQSEGNRQLAERYLSLAMDAFERLSEAKLTRQGDFSRKR